MEHTSQPTNGDSLHVSHHILQCEQQQIFSTFFCFPSQLISQSAIRNPKKRKAGAEYSFLIVPYKFKPCVKYTIVYECDDDLLTPLLSPTCNDHRCAQSQLNTGWLSIYDWIGWNAAHIPIIPKLKASQSGARQ